MKAIIACTALWVVVLGGFTGWLLNLVHCLSYISGGHPDDSTAEVAMRIVGIFTFIPGAIAGWL